MSVQNAPSSPSRVKVPVMADVAKLAGVSLQTVSRVLNGHQWVSDETRAKVMKAVDSLGYRPNLAARALASSRSKIIGVVVVNVELFGPSGALLGIEQAARTAGYWVSVASLPKVGIPELNNAIDHFIDQQVDAIVVIAPNQLILDAAARVERNTPLIAVTAGEIDSGILSTVDFDQELGARLAMRHLIGLGHTRIAHFSGPKSEFHSQSRQLGWEKELAAHGLPKGQLYPGDWTGATGYQLARDLLATGGELPTAIFVANDHAAMGVLRAFGDAGLRVPEDISIVGFDDI
ncbi:MAG: LacI family transcriptional regulator, partial [Propionibacteriaceae bacterium]|nr:LacI family transcriptional regulator [Propionibacteriaceae bacterium]